MVKLKTETMRGIYLFEIVFLVILAMKMNSRYLLIEIRKEDGAQEATQTNLAGSRNGTLKIKNVCL